KVVAVCDILPETAQSLARDFNIPKIHVDYEELIADPEIDIIDVATPNTFHTPIVLAALRAGKHVLCEKPLATTSASIREIGETAAQSPGLLMVGQSMRYIPAAVAI